MSADNTMVERIYFLDGLRAVLLLLGIPYHAALAFSGEIWLVTNNQASAPLVLFSEFLHIWRMPTFYVVAGFFAVLILRRRRSAAWLRGRFKRLGVPLLAGMLLLSPIQWAVLSYQETGSVGDTWSTIVERAGTPSWWWTMHLWFLLELLIYCTILGGIAASSWRERVGSWARRLTIWYGRRPFVAACAILGLAGVVVITGLATWQAVDGQTLFHGLVSRNLIIFAPAFVVGCLLGSSADALIDFGRASWAVTLPIACVAVLGILLLAGFSDSVVTLSIHAVLWTVGGLTIAAIVFRLARSGMNRESFLISWVVDASLIVYLVHQPFILMVAPVVSGWGIPPLAGWAVTMVVVAVASFATYELVNLIPGLRFGLSGRADRSSSVFGRRG